MTFVSVGSHGTIMRTLATAFGAATASLVSTPGITVVGWPNATQLGKIVNQQQYMVTLYPQKPREAEHLYNPEPGYIGTTAPTAPLTASVTQGSTLTTISLSGTNAPNLNIHVLVGPPSGGYDVLFQTTGSETISAIATSIAALINALGVSAYVATTSANNVLVSGSTPVAVQIGQPLPAAPATGYPQYVYEIGRFTRDVQITVWSWSPDIIGIAGQPNNDGNRENVEDVVLNTMGGTDTPYVFTPEGIGIKALWLAPADWSDKPENSYGTFRSDSTLKIEYGLYKPISATPVGSIDLTLQVDQNAPSTLRFGG